MSVTVFADVSSPWTYVGHLALREALRACGDLPLELDVECRPFRLAAFPDGARAARDATRRFQPCVDRAKQYGVTLYVRPPPPARAVSPRGSYAFVIYRRRLGGKIAESTNAQRLLLLAYRRGGQAAQQSLLHAILRCCYEDEACCDDPEMLADCAQAVGFMPADGALRFLGTADLLIDVDCMAREARDLGITAVPCVVFGGKWVVSGAQTADVYARVRPLVWPTESAVWFGSS